MKKTNYQIGHDAEKQAAKYLESRGYEVVELNWKTPTCEIDIVAKRGNKIYFFEVKHRKNERFGSGLEYVTDKKVKQMSYGAEFWVLKNNWFGDYQLGVVAIDGPKISLILLD